jgi:mitochondrial import receptor subunit TOM40
MGSQTSKNKKTNVGDSVKYTVLATSTAPDFGVAPTTSGDLPVFMQQVQDIEKEREKLPNPGFVENATDSLKRPLMPDVFDGFRFDFTRILGQKFSTSHSFVLGSAMAPGGVYQFGANVVAGDAMDPATFLMSKLSPDGFLHARWNQKLSENWKLRAKGQFKMEEHGSDAIADFDYTGEDFTWNMKIGNGPLYGVSYFQSVTPNLALGGEGYFHGTQKRVISSYIAKYNCAKWSGAATIAGMGILQLQYLRKVSHRIQYASELVYNQPTGESSASVGVAVDLNQTRVCSRVDQTGHIMTSIESRVLPNFILNLSAEGVPTKSEFKFGYGAQITF